MQSSTPDIEQAGRLLLTPTAARVLGTLMEKARTVPGSYPLSLNSLMLGCNQKSSRDPVMELTEPDIAEALADLQSAGLVRENKGSRVVRFEHNAQRGIGVPEQSAVLLGLLMLRGPQTAAELRLNTDRWYKFADVSSVEGFLEEMQDRQDDRGGPLVVKLPRVPGTREQRWAHLLCGPIDQTVGTASQSIASPHVQGLQGRVAQLEAEVSKLWATVHQLCADLGVKPADL